jgi:hypothetical protein
MGLQEHTPSLFEANESVLFGGVLISIPSLIAQGFNVFSTSLLPLPNGFYGLQQLLLLYCFMMLARIKNPEQLKQYPPGELGKLLGLDRCPEVGHFRTKLAQIYEQNNVDTLLSNLFKFWLKDQPEVFFYIDGHVRVYHGTKANLPKRFVSREKLCLSGTTEFWINNSQGLPLMFITGELNERLKDAILLAISKIKSDLPDLPVIHNVMFVLVFDREAYEPKWFQNLLEEEHVAIITYRKNVKDLWDENLFQPIEVKINNNNVQMKLHEQEVELSACKFREVRRLSGVHQTSIITTHPSLNIADVAGRMFSRWTQENFFKYMIENLDFDKTIENGYVEVNKDLTIVNPERKKLNYLIKAERQKKARVDTKLIQKITKEEGQDPESIGQRVLDSDTLLKQSKAHQLEIERLRLERKEVPTRIKVEEMTDDKKFNKLKNEGKKFKNAIAMTTYRAETSVYNALVDIYKDYEKDGRMLIKDLFTSDADIIPDEKNQILLVRIHTLSTPRANQAAKKICELMNETETKFPGTQLVLTYEMNE